MEGKHEHKKEFDEHAELMIGKLSYYLRTYQAPSVYVFSCSGLEEREAMIIMRGSASKLTEIALSIMDSVSAGIGDENMIRLLDKLNSAKKREQSEKESN